MRTTVARDEARRDGALLRLVVRAEEAPHELGEARVADRRDVRSALDPPELDVDARRTPTEGRDDGLVADKGGAHVELLARGRKPAAAAILRAPDVHGGGYRRIGTLRGAA